MVIKIWDVENGKVTHLKHTNSKNESMLLKLKVPAEPGRVPLSSIDDAFELITGLVSSIKKFDNSGVVNRGKDNKEEANPERNIEAKTEGSVEAKTEGSVEAKTEGSVEDKPYVNIEPWVKICAHPKVSIDPWVKRHVGSESNVEVKPEIKEETNQDIEVEAKPEIKEETNQDIKVEAKPGSDVKIGTLEEEYDKDNGKEVPKEVSDKLNLLLQEDEGKRDGPQFLIDINAKKCVGNDKSPLPPQSSKPNIIVVPNEDVVSEEKSKVEKKQRYSGYGEAIVKCVPKILEDIANSNDAKVLINASDLAKRMGEEFDGIKPSLLDSNVRYKFFDHGLIMEMLSSDNADNYTDKSDKVFRFRLKNDHDKLPDSILRQRNELDTNEVDT